MFMRYFSRKLTMEVINIPDEYECIFRFRVGWMAKVGGLIGWRRQGGSVMGVRGDTNWCRGVGGSCKDNAMLLLYRPDRVVRRILGPDDKWRLNTGSNGEAFNEKPIWARSHVSSQTFDSGSITRPQRNIRFIGQCFISIIIMHWIQYDA